MRDVFQPPHGTNTKFAEHKKILKGMTLYSMQRFRDSVSGK